MPTYIALLRKDPGSDFGVEFPDVPGCVTAGSTIEEAKAMATEALAAHLALLRSSRDTLPRPSSLSLIAALPQCNGAALLVVNCDDALIARRA